MCARPNMAVFCSSLISCLPCTFLRYCLNESEVVPLAPVISGITFVFTFDMRWTSVVRSLYFEIFRLLSWRHFYPLYLKKIMLIEWVYTVPASPWTSGHFCSVAERMEFFNFNVSVGSHDVIVLNAHAQIEDTNDDSKDNFYEKIQQAFCHFPKYQKNFCY